MLEFFNTIVYVPLYNALAALVDIIPTADLGIAVILLTLLVKLVLLPLSLKAAHTQHALKELEPQLKQIRDKYKNNNEEVARRTLALYKENDVSIFASILVAIIQIPIVIALYFVFLHIIQSYAFDPSLLYSFVSVPAAVSHMFLGFVDLTHKSIALAVLAALAQFFQGLVAMPKPVEKKPGEARTFQEDLAKSFSVQMKYVLPIVIGIAAYTISSAIALYFIASAVFAVAQEYISRWSIRRKAASKKRNLEKTV